MKERRKVDRRSSAAPAPAGVLRLSLAAARLAQQADAFDALANKDGKAAAAALQRTRGDIWDARAEIASKSDAALQLEREFALATWPALEAGWTMAAAADLEANATRTLAVLDDWEALLAEGASGERAQWRDDALATHADLHVSVAAERVAAIISLSEVALLSDAAGDGATLRGHAAAQRHALRLERLLVHELLFAAGMRSVDEKVDVRRRRPSFKWRRRDDTAMEAAAAALERLRRGAPVQAWVDAAVALVASRCATRRDVRRNHRAAVAAADANDDADDDTAAASNDAAADAESSAEALERLRDAACSFRHVLCSGAGCRGDLGAALRAFGDDAKTLVKALALRLVDDAGLGLRVLTYSALAAADFEAAEVADDDADEGGDASSAGWLKTLVRAVALVEKLIVALATDDLVDDSDRCTDDGANSDSDSDGDGARGRGVPDAAPDTGPRLADAATDETRMCLFAAFETLFDPSVHYTYARREEAWLRSACHTDFRRGIYVSKALNDADESAWVASFGSRLESLPQLLELLARVQYHRRFEGALGQALRRAERVLPAARHCAPERSGATKAGVGAAALREIVGAAATSQSPVSAARKAGQLSAAATRADTAESVAEALRAIADAAFHTAAQSAVHAAVSLMASHADAKRAVVAAKADADVGAVKGASWFASRSAKKAPQHATDPSKKEHVGVGSGSEAAFASLGKYGAPGFDLYLVVAHVCAGERAWHARAMKRGASSGAALEAAAARRAATRAAVEAAIVGRALERTVDALQQATLDSKLRDASDYNFLKEPDALQTTPATLAFCQSAHALVEVVSTIFAQDDWLRDTWRRVLAERLSRVVRAHFGKFKVSTAGAFVLTRDLDEIRDALATLLDAAADESLAEMREVAALLELDVASLCVLVAQRDGVLKSLRKEQVVSVVLRRCDAYTNRGKKAPWLDGFFARLNEAYDGG